jgi:hypothetical protein
MQSKSSPFGKSFNSFGSANSAGSSNLANRAKKKKLLKRRKQQEKLTAHDIKNRLDTGSDSGMGGSSSGDGMKGLKSGIPNASRK